MSTFYLFEIIERSIVQRWQHHFFFVRINKRPREKYCNLPMFYKDINCLKLMNRHLLSSNINR